MCIAKLYESQKVIHHVTSPLNMGKTNFGRRGLAPDAAAPTEGLMTNSDLGVLMCPQILDCLDSILVLYSIIFATVDLASSISPSISPKFATRKYLLI